MDETLRRVYGAVKKSVPAAAAEAGVYRSIITTLSKPLYVTSALCRAAFPIAERWRDH
jgi:hypothetical protein